MLVRVTVDQNSVLVDGHLPVGVWSTLVGQFSYAVADFEYWKPVR
ncbi:hypothetical protein ABZ892_15695 [Streptomyces sp. NPDC046924]